MVGAGINMMGVVPVFGDVAAKGAKSALRGLDSGGNLVQQRMLIPDVEEGRRRLYNAGTIDRDPQGYLEPHTSDWVKEVAEGSGYEGNIEDITSDLVYMSEKPDWVTSIIARGIGKDMADVTLDDVRRYGRLNIIDAEIDADEIFQIGDYSQTRKIKDIAGNERNLWDTSLYDDERFADIPIGPEPDDFISNEPQEITYTLTGDDLVDFLNENEPDMMKRLKGSASSSGKSALRGLDMNPEARMQRAQDQGYMPETLYHGTAQDIEAFDPAQYGGSVTKANSAKMGTWMSDDPTVAAGYARMAAEDAPVQKLIDQSDAAGRKGNYDLQEKLISEAEALELGGDLVNAGGQNIIPLRARGNLFEVDAEGATMGDLDDSQLFKWSQEAKAQGFDGLKIKNFSDNADYGTYTPATHYLIFDPKNIRSTNAEFDPEKMDSADLLSSVGTTSALRGIA